MGRSGSGCASGWSWRGPSQAWSPPAAALIGVAGSNHRYRRSSGVERQRMQWFGWAVAVGTEVVLIVLALRLLAGWPPHVDVVCAAATLPIPVALIVGSSSRLIGRID